MTLEGKNVNPREVAGAFAISDKVKLNVAKTRIDTRGVYNGKNKIIVQNRDFMTENDVIMCMNELKKCSPTLTEGNPHGSILELQNFNKGA